LRAAGTADDAALDGWLSGLRRLDAREEFLLSVNDYAVIATRP
jgi:hypothetical protein